MPGLIDALADVIDVRSDPADSCSQLFLLSVIDLDTDKISAN